MQRDKKNPHKFTPPAPNYNEWDKGTTPVLQKPIMDIVSSIIYFRKYNMRGGENRRERNLGVFSPDQSI